MIHRTRPESPFAGAFRRLRYEQGQLLCAAQFQAEQAHFLQQDALAGHALHGAGTVSGLKLALQGATLTVAPGLALDTTGRFLLVSRPLTVDLQPSGEPRRGGVTQYVVLEGAESEHGAYIWEQARVQLRSAPPDDTGAGLARSFAALMSRVVPGPFSTVTVAGICSLVRELTPDQEEPDHTLLQVEPHLLQTVWQEALRTFVTEVLGRQALDPAQHQSASGVLLGTVHLHHHRVELSEEGRPVLAPTYLLQECASPAQAPGWPGRHRRTLPWPFRHRRRHHHHGPGHEPAGVYRLAAAARVAVLRDLVIRVDGTGLELADVEPEGGRIYRIRFAGYTPHGVYVVKGTPVTTDDAPPSTFEVLEPAPRHGGLRVRVSNGEGGDGVTGFMVEIFRVVP
jgi:hypothetical protein